MLQPIIM